MQWGVPWKVGCFMWWEILRLQPAVNLRMGGCSLAPKGPHVLTARPQRSPVSQVGCVVGARDTPLWFGEIQAPPPPF